MKRAIFLIMAMILCFCLFACSKDAVADIPVTEMPVPTTQKTEPTSAIEDTIIGAWYAVSSETENVTFNEDGSGEWITETDKFDFNWNYDSDLMRYTVATTEFLPAFFELNNGIEQLVIGSVTFVRFEDHEQAYSDYLLLEKSKVFEKYTLGYDRLEIGKKYTQADGLVFSVESTEKTTENTPEGQTDVVWLTIAFDNPANDDSIHENVRIQGGMYTMPVHGAVHDSMTWDTIEYVGNTGYGSVTMSPQMMHQTCMHYKDYTPQGSIRFPLCEYDEDFVELYNNSPIGFVTIEIGSVRYYIHLEDLPPVS